MTMFYDGTHAVEISMAIWTGNSYSLNWEQDFFEIGSLERVNINGKDYYKVDDVKYLIENASDWANYQTIDTDPDCEMQAKLYDDENGFERTVQIEYIF